jgi:uncharacterized protein YecT (DUF1311 family)
MRASLIMVIGFMAILPAAPAQTQNKPDKDCDGGTYQLVECLNAKAARWGRRLNAAYQQALKDALPRQRDLLRHTQRAWIRFRDAECDYVAAGEGSIARVEAAECLRSMTEKRARGLEMGEHLN